MKAAITTTKHAEKPFRLDVTRGYQPINRTQIHRSFVYTSPMPEAHDMISSTATQICTTRTSKTRIQKIVLPDNATDKRMRCCQKQIYHRPWYCTYFSPPATVKRAASNAKNYDRAPPLQLSGTQKKTFHVRTTKTGGVEIKKFYINYMCPKNVVCHNQQRCCR